MSSTRTAASSHPPQIDERATSTNSNSPENIAASKRPSHMHEQDSASAIQKSEANLRAIFDNARDGFVLIDLETKVLAFNHPAANLYEKVIGKTLSIGKSVPEIFGPQSGDTMRTAFEKVMTGESVERKSKHRGSDGKEYWLGVCYNPVKSIDETIIGVCMGISDITLEIEANIYASELAAIVTSSDDAIISKTLTGIVTSWNPAAQKIFGYSAKEMIGKSITKLIPADRLNEEPEILERLNKGERIEHFETIRLTKKGTPLNISLTISPIMSGDGVLIGASKIARDITGQKLLQEILRATDANFREELEKKVDERTAQLQEKNESILRQRNFVETVLDSSVDQISVYDMDFRFIGANKVFSKMSGVQADKILGKTFLEVFPSDENSPLYRAIGQTLTMNQPVTIDSVSEDTGRYYNIYCAPLVQNNVVYGAIVIAHDNTAIIEAAENLKKSNENLKEKISELEQSNDELENFAHIASHDLQEPLRKIQLFSARIRKQNNEIMDETSQNYFNKIDASSERMSILIKDILRYSRLNSSSENLERTDLNDVITHALSDLDLIIEEKKATIETSKLPTIDGFPVQLTQLFHNLIGNSLKFSREDIPPNIRIFSHTLSSDEILQRNLDETNSYYKITLADNGIGFDQEFSEKIFVIFQRLNERTKYGGTGIGLALCRRIVDNHHGIISAESQEGESSEFHIILPEKQRS